MRKPITAAIAGFLLACVVAAPAAGKADLEQPQFAFEVLPDPEPVFEQHVVRRGEWLWGIARSRFSARYRRAPTPSEVRREVEVIYGDNSETIGRNPNRLRPGQVLRIRTGVFRGPPTP